MEFVKEHLGFILTIVITYVLGISLIIVQYIALGDGNDFMKVLLDSLIPTTITYVLGCVLVNISELLRDKSNNYVYMYICNDLCHNILYVCDDRYFENMDNIRSFFYCYFALVKYNVLQRKI